MTHEVTWTALQGDDCLIGVTLTSEAFAGSERDFPLVMDAAIDEIEDVFAKEYKRRTGKTL